MSSCSKISNNENNESYGMEHACHLAEWIGDLLFDDETADVNLIVGGKCLPAHRAILGSSSAYFRALLLGDTQGSLQNEVVLNVPLRGFKVLMGYIYTGQVRLGELDVDAILEILDISHFYGPAKLEASLTRHLKKSISQKNVGKIYSQAHRLDLSDLGEACYSFMTQDPDATLKTEAFCDLSPAAVCHVLSQETFLAQEIGIFEAVLRWRAKHQAKEDLERILKAVRLPLIDRKDLVTTVKNSGLISMELIVDAIEAQECHAADRNFRGSLRNDVNLATAECGALVLIPKSRGGSPAARSCSEYESKEMPPFTSMSTFPTAPGFTIALSKPFFVNHIEFHLKGNHRCRYYVETSVDLKDWVRIIDGTNYLHYSFQDLYFERRVVRYVRLILTTNLEDEGEYEDEDDIMFTKLAVNHITKPFKLSRGYYAPEENVASKARGAYAFGSKDGSEALIQEGGTDAKDGVEWSSHDIGDGSIRIFLPQPFTVGSMRMLLRSDESRAYSYYVETSVDYETWTRVAERTTDLCRSWQHITFDPRPVLYINIVGTASTVDKVFSCSRFECPAPLRDGDDARNGAGGSGIKDS